MSKKLINIFNPFYREESDSSDLLYKFKTHYLETNEFVRKTIYWNIRNESIVDEIVQESYLKAWKAYPTFKQNSSFRTWIYRIAMNCIKDYFRKNKSSYEALIEESISEKNELKDLISKGLFSLSADEREVFILYFKFEYSFREISELLKLAEGTVKTRLYRAKENFENFLEKNGGAYE